MEASTQTVTLVSKTDGQGNPILGDCNVITGFGSLTFVRGRCHDVPIDAARQIAHNRADVMIEGGDPGNVDPPAQPAEPPTPPEPPAPPEPPEDPDAAAAEAERQRLIEEHLREDGEEDAERVPESPPPTPEDENPETEQEGSSDEPPPGDEEEGSSDEPPPGETEQLREGAARHNKVIPAGFAPLTSEGDLRCLATKGDGGQCGNAAKDPENMDACGLSKHQEQVAALADAPGAA